MSKTPTHKEELMSDTTPTPTPELPAPDDMIAEGEIVEETAETPEPETTAQRLVRELKEKHFGSAAGHLTADDEDRLATQIDEDIINPIMLARYLGIVPQQVYQAIAKGKLPVIEDNDTQKRRIRFDDAVRWAANYLDRKDLRERQKAQAEQVAIEG